MPEMRNEGEMAMNGPKYKPADYVAAEPVLFEVKKHYRAGRISWQQAQTLKGQALAGDVYGAKKGLRKLIEKEDRADG